MNWLWPIHTGITFLDYWALSHFMFWFVVGSSTAVFKKRGIVLFVALSVALWWEVFERFAEKQWPNLWLSPESWWNAWLSDPLMCVVAIPIAWWGYDRWRPK